MDDEFYMQRAISLARKARPSPNPPVGAVLVKNGRIIAEGYHAKAGTLHAEALALKKAGSQAKGATLYVTLEPCTAHKGKKTPPCTRVIIASGVKRVVYACEDPNPKIHGGKLLSKAGVKVVKGVCQAEGFEVIKFFSKFIKTRRPFVTIKTAQTLDGKIATAQGKSKWITGPQALAYSHALRTQHDAILVGINTVLADDPRLTDRSGRKLDPLRVVLDPRLRIPLNARVLKDPNAVVYTEKTGAKVEKLRRKGIEVVQIKPLKLSKVLADLAKRGVMSVLIEGGGETNARALEENAVDEIQALIAPKILGGRNAITSVEGNGRGIDKTIELQDVKIEKIGRDFLVKATIRK